MPPAAAAAFVVPLLLLLLLLLRAPSKRRWRPRACPVDLSGKTAVVTGANSGIGKCVALDLARRNARTILACRDKEKGRAARDEIQRATGNPNVHLRLLDLCSMASVRDFATQFLKEEPRMDILVNNAGITGLPGTPSTKSLELLFATNVRGPFLLTHLLLDTLKASSPARIVNVSSFVHGKGTMNVRYLTGEEWPKSGSHAYNSSKLMNVVFTIELARQLWGTGVTVNCVNPGVVRTNIMSRFHWAVRLLFTLCSIFMKSAEEGAVSTLYCAVSREVEDITGKYFDDDCSLVLPSTQAQDAEVARRLWGALEQLTGLRNEGTPW
ncbi:retinol dehydrogenase 11-like [Paroedura picta]|uniref:retinol dehydrogenase 11-like n=1 Tax=Paroedura picta TaxID=143630 RepID=UPI004056D493